MSEEHRPESRVRRVVRWAARLWVAGWTLGALLRLYPSDLFLPTELLLLLPWPVFLGPALLLTPFVGGKRMALAAAGVVVLAAGVTLAVEQPRLLTSADGDVSLAGATPVTLTMWNVMSFNRDQQGVLDAYSADEPDVLIMVEGTYRGGAPSFLRDRMGDDYEWAATRHMAVGSKLPIRAYRELETASPLRVFHVELETAEGTPFALLVVDAPKPPRRTTRAIMNDLWSVVETEELPFVMTGDLNTPRGSWAMARATRNLQDFYVEAGERGWLGTWPSAAAWFQIDHAFASDGVAPLRARVGETLASDHKRLRLVFLVEAAR